MTTNLDLSDLGLGLTKPDSLMITAPQESFFHRIKKNMFGGNQTQDKDFDRILVELNNVNKVVLNVSLNLNKYVEQMRLAMHSSIVITQLLGTLVSKTEQSGTAAAATPTTPSVTDDVTALFLGERKVLGFIKDSVQKHIDDELNLHKELFKKSTERQKLLEDFDYYRTKLTQMKEERDRRNSNSESRSDVEKWARNSQKFEEARVKYEQFNKNLMQEMKTCIFSHGQEFSHLHKQFTTAEHHFLQNYRDAIGLRPVPIPAPLNPNRQQSLGSSSSSEIKSEVKSAVMESPEPVLASSSVQVSAISESTTKASKKAKTHKKNKSKSVEQKESISTQAQAQASLSSPVVTHSVSSPISNSNAATRLVQVQSTNPAKSQPPLPVLPETNKTVVKNNGEPGEGKLRKGENNNISHAAPSTADKIASKGFHYFGEPAQLVKTKSKNASVVVTGSPEGQQQGDDEEEEQEEDQDEEVTETSSEEDPDVVDSDDGELTALTK